MKRFIFFFVIGVLIYCSASGADVVDSTKKDSVVYWKKGGAFSLVFNQLSLTNWAKGGESAISALGIFNLFAAYKDSNFVWENILDMNYGGQQSDETGVRKNQDKIDMMSKLGYQAYSKLYYSAIVNFKSQFSAGYNYPNDSVLVSKFFSPSYIIASVGMDYIPSEVLTLYLSPFTGKYIFVMDERLADLGTYTSEPAIYDTSKNIITHGKKFKADFGAYLRAKLNWNISPDFMLVSRLELFNNYTDKNSYNRGNIDVECESMLMMKVNNHISANILLHLVYDHDIKIPLYEKINGLKTKVGEGPRLQVKEAIGIAINYVF